MGCYIAAKGSYIAPTGSHSCQGILHSCQGILPSCQGTLQRFTRFEKNNNLFSPDSMVLTAPNFTSKHVGWGVLFFFKPITPHYGVFFFVLLRLSSERVTFTSNKKYLSQLQTSLKLASIRPYTWNENNLPIVQSIIQGISFNSQNGYFFRLSNDSGCGNWR